MKGIAALAAAGFAGLAAAQPAGFELRPWAGRDNLDHGYADWREAGVEFAWRAAADRVLLVRARETERYNLRDREAAALVAWPLSEAWHLSVEATGAGHAEVLPEWSAVATLVRRLGEGWLASGSWKQAQYATSEVATATAGLERYVGPFRVAYTAYLSRPAGAAWSPTHRVTAAWYGEGLTRVEAGLARGRETENTPAGLVTSDVRNATLSASLGLTPTWAVTLDLERQRQGELYTRQSVRLGARAFF